MPEDAPSEFDFLSLHGALRRERALEQLLAADTVLGADAELCINAQGVDYVDVVAATATRMRIARHRRLHPAGRVTIWLPETAGVAVRYRDMLEPLEDRVETMGSSAAAPAHYTLLPATSIDDSEAARLAGEYVFDACRDAHISRRRTGYITQAVIELADNAVTHATGATDAPVVAVNSFGRERSVEVAVTDAGTGIADAADPAEILRTLPGCAIAGGRGFLAQILRHGQQAGVEVTVEVIAGTARLRWSRTSHATVRRRHVPGLTVVAA
jgi:anti-sigma regulatory factor (Ser/Thr protein kinase)